MLGKIFGFVLFLFWVAVVRDNYAGADSAGEFFSWLFTALVMALMLAGVHWFICGVARGSFDRNADNVDRRYMGRCSRCDGRGSYDAGSHGRIWCQFCRGTGRANN